MRPSHTPPTSEITPESLYMRRREFIRNGALSIATAAGVGGGLLWLMGGQRGGKKKAVKSAPETPPDAAGAELTIARHSALSTDELLTPYDDVTTYNNFYEFGTDKAAT